MSFFWKSVRPVFGNCLILSLQILVFWLATAVSFGICMEKLATLSNHPSKQGEYPLKFSDLLSGPVTQLSLQSSRVPTWKPETVLAPLFDAMESTGRGGIVYPWPFIVDNVVTCPSCGTTFVSLGELGSKYSAQENVQNDSKDPYALVPAGTQIKQVSLRIYDRNSRQLSKTLGIPVVGNTTNTRAAELTKFSDKHDFTIVHLPREYVNMLSELRAESTLMEQLKVRGTHKDSADFAKSYNKSSQRTGGVLRPLLDEELKGTFSSRIDAEFLLLASQILFLLVTAFGVLFLTLKFTTVNFRRFAIERFYGRTLSALILRQGALSLLVVVVPTCLGYGLPALAIPTIRVMLPYVIAFTGFTTILSSLVFCRQSRKESWCVIQKDMDS